MLGKEEESINRLLYTGQIYDEAMGQYYLRARYYSPTVGRFLQEDVYRGDGLNLYAYCGNHPVRYYDPSGYLKICNAEDVNWKGFNSSKDPETGLSKLQGHYQKHVIDGGEFGDISQNEYLKMAKDFSKESNMNFLQKQVGNIIVKYDPETRRMFIGNIKDREIRTFYMADSRTTDPFAAAVEEALRMVKK